MYGLLGKSLKHSLSKKIHERLNKTITYNLYETDDLKAFFRARPFKAINVTNPYKEACLPYIDRLDASAKAIGAVNTIVDEDGLLIGYNTDYKALRTVIAKHFPADTSTFVGIVGNGATSKTLLKALHDDGYVNVMVFARHPSVNEESLSAIETYTSLRVLINATPLGMYPNTEQSFDFSLDIFKQLTLVFDLIYNPLKTNLLLEAKKENIPYINGLPMLVKQAMFAQEIFFATSFEKVYERFYKSLEIELYNIVFIGLPFSGKSHYGRLLSTLYDKPFIDIDQSIERQEHAKIETLFTTQGEAYFRALEEKKVLSIAKRHAQVVAPGGGIIQSASAMHALMHNSLIIFLDLDLSILSPENLRNRPLIQNINDLKSLQAKRQPLYETYASITIRKDTWDEAVIINRIKEAIDDYFNH